MDPIATLQEPSGLGPFLDVLHHSHGAYDVLEHWQQGEFHHDLVLRVRDARKLPAEVVVLATNCNAGIKEVLWFDQAPSRGALWRWRCPDNPEFSGVMPTLVLRWQTSHWFHPSALLEHDTRSELRPSCRTRAVGGGWSPL